MNRAMGLGIAMVALGAAGFCGYRLGADAGSQNPSLVDELRGQRAALDRIDSKIAKLERQCARASAQGGGLGTINLDRLKARLLPALQDAQGQPDESTRERTENAPRKPTHEQSAAYAEGERLLDDALSEGIWDEDRRAALRELLGSTSGDQAGTLLQRLSAAINADKLEVQVDGPPL